MILRGVEQAAFINSVVTVAKIVPIIVAILALIFAFNYTQFSENFFGGVGHAGQDAVRAGARHHADHRVRLPRHRRRQRLFALRQEALGRRHARPSSASSA